MNKQELVRAFAIAAVALLGLSLNTSIILANDDTGVRDKRAKFDRIPWTGPVPKANCRPRDRAESGLQGQTTPEERFSGDSEDGYNCNLELVGQFQGEVAKSQGGPAYSDDCAYYATNNNALQQHRGVVVVDATDQRHPEASAYLDDTPTMLDPHESLKLNNRRKLLAGFENKGLRVPIPAATGFASYDVAKDCRHPILLSSISIPNSVGHAGDFTPDGRTFYGTHTLEIGMTVVDVSDPTQPKFLGFIDQLAHDVALSNDGTRAYVSHIGHGPPTFPALT